MAKRESGLGQLTDGISSQLAGGGRIAPSLRLEWVGKLLERQIRSGKDAGAFKLSAIDLSEPIRLFTGEPLRTKLAAKYCLTAESARLLRLLADNGDTKSACRLAEDWILFSSE